MGLSKVGEEVLLCVLGLGAGPFKHGCFAPHIAPASCLGHGCTSSFFFFPLHKHYLCTLWWKIIIS